MESLNNIITNLTKVADTMGYTGPTVDAIIYLAANSIYNNEINAITAVLEASPSRCKLINSAIQHAKDIGYSVNRGTNQHITISGLVPIESKTYNKYDQAAKIGNYYLYFAERTTVISGQTTSIKFIVGKNILEEDITVSKESDKLKLKSTKTNYSNDITFSKVTSIEVEELNTTEIKRDLFEVNSDTNYWIVTSTDYGVEVYVFPKNVSVDNIAQFEADEVYRLKGVEYLNDIIDSTAIKTIPGFKFTDKTTISEQTIVEPRTDDITKIYTDSMKSLDSSFVIRTTDDLSKAILSMNNSIKACNIIVTPPVMTETTTSTGGILIYYLTSDLVSGISASEENAIALKLRNSYYVDHSFDFTVASGYRDSEGAQYKLYLNIYYHNNVDSGKVEEYIRSYNYSIGKSFNPNKIIGGLVANFPEISYVSFQKLNSESDELGSDEYEIDEEEMGANRFIDFELKVNYYSTVR